MQWKDIFPSDRQPTLNEIADYIGGDAKELWNSLLQYMDRTYKAKPKMSYSVCAGKPGWNIKFQKSRQSFGTLYPKENAFSVFIVISYKLEPLIEEILPKLSEYIVSLYQKAEDYMKLGKWMMFQIKDQKSTNVPVFIKDAYCGLFCFGCKTKINSIYCKDCQVKSCAREKNYQFCYECIEYPCVNLQSFVTSGHVHKNIVVENLNFIKKYGKEHWIQAQEEFWSCPNCQKTFSYYEKACRQCGQEVG